MAPPAAATPTSTAPAAEGEVVPPSGTPADRQTPSATLTALPTRTPTIATRTPPTGPTAAQQVDPQPGVISVRPDETRQFGVGVRGGPPTASAYEWRLDGDLVATGSTYRLAPGAVAEGQPRKLVVTAPRAEGGGEVGRWTIEIPAQAGKLQFQIVAPRSEVAVGETVKIQAKFAGLSEQDKLGLSCIWSLNGQPRTPYCQEFEFHAPAEPGTARITLSVTPRGGKMQSRDTSITVRAGAPSSAPTIAATPRARSAAPPPPSAAKASPPNTSVSAGETGVRNAVAVYYSSLQAYAQKSQDPQAQVSFEILSLQPAADGWQAVARRTTEIRGQRTVKEERLGIIQSGGNWMVKQ